MTDQAIKELNGFHVEQLRQKRGLLAKDPEKARGVVNVVAEWLGAYRSRLEETGSGAVVHAGGEGDMDAMQMLLASFVACNVMAVAFHASRLEIEIEDLSVEATGEFDIRGYMDLDETLKVGYEEIDYTVRINAPDATQEQLDYLRERAERSSLVGGSLEREIQLNLEFEGRT